MGALARQSWARPATPGSAAVEAEVARQADSDRRIGYGGREPVQRRAAGVGCGHHVVRHSADAFGLPFNERSVTACPGCAGATLGCGV